MIDAETLNCFATSFRERVEIRCESGIDDDEKFQENMFTSEFLECIQSADDITDWQMCHFENEAARVKVNAIDLREESDCLSIIITQFTNAIPPITLSKDTVDIILNKARRFYKKCLDGFYKLIDESSPVYDYARQIFMEHRRIKRIRYYLLTDAKISKPLKDEEQEGDVKILYSLWDISRLQRVEGVSGGREIITIDFVSEHGGSIPCLLLADNNLGVEHETCVAIFPGKVLADMYERYDAKLLQRNVRAFLQARGGVNSSIRNTILQEPERFLAYNNGITATAADVKFIQSKDGWGIESVTDFQIVNGGQTTAGIYYAKKRKEADLSKVYVQARITKITNPELFAQIVPLISKYANSQNKISESDFSSNDPIHTRLHELSQLVWTDLNAKQTVPTHWYYERARGQYAEEKTKRGAKFTKANPIHQLFDKTEMAKVATCFEPAPHLASLGPQKNFLNFTKALRAEMEEAKEKNISAEALYSEEYFKKLVAKVIIYRFCKQQIEKLKASYPANRNNIAVYALALLVEHGKLSETTLLEVWKTQTPPAYLEKHLPSIFEAVHKTINEIRGDRIYTEVCKKSTTWDALKKIAIF